MGVKGGAAPFGWFTRSKRFRYTYAANDAVLGCRVYYSLVSKLGSNQQVVVKSGEIALDSLNPQESKLAVPISPERQVSDGGAKWGDYEVASETHSLESARGSAGNWLLKEDFLEYDFPAEDVDNFLAFITPHITQAKPAKIISVANFVVNSYGPWTSRFDKSSIQKLTLSMLRKLHKMGTFTVFNIQQNKIHLK